MFDVGTDRPYDVLVESIRRNTDGSIKTAWVINGRWNLQLKGSVLLAKSGQVVITRLPYKSVCEHPVPQHIRGDYNAIMEAVRAYL